LRVLRIRLDGLFVINQSRIVVFFQLGLISVVKSAAARSTPQAEHSRNEHADQTNFPNPHHISLRIERFLPIMA
jgi:hypothetical protein